MAIGRLVIPVALVLSGVLLPNYSWAKITSVVATPFGDNSAFEEQPSDAIELDFEDLTEKAKLETSVIGYDDIIEVQVSDVPVRIRVSGHWAYSASCRLDFLFQYRQVLNAYGQPVPNAPRKVQAGTVGDGATFHYTYTPGQTTTLSLSHFANADQRPWAALPQGFLGNRTFGDFGVGEDCDGTWPAPFVEDNRPVNNAGLLEDCEIRHSSSMRITDPNPGSFSAVYSSTGVTSWCQRYSITARINSPTEPFAVMATQPGSDECGVVDPSQPTLRVRFDDDLDKSTVKGNFRLRELGTDAIFRLKETTPKDDIVKLEYGGTLPVATKLVLEARTGEQGLRSATGIKFGNNGDWVELIRFHTSPISVDSEVGSFFIEKTGVYQTVKDRRLLRGKWTMSRVWADWTIDGPENEGLKEFCVKARGLDVATKEELFPEIEEDLKRQDDYKDEEKRLARHTVNLFGWEAAQSTSEIQFELEPRKYHRDGSAQDADPPKEKFIKPIQHVLAKPAQLDIRFAQMTMPPEFGFKNAPSNRLAWNVDAASEYMVQVMPIVSVSSSQLGSVSPSQLGISYDKEALDQMGEKERITYLKKMDAIATQIFASRYCSGQFQICVLSQPTAVGTHATTAVTINGTPVRSLRFSESMFSLRPEMLTAGHVIAHEISHGYGLAHIPNSNAAQRKILKSDVARNIRSPFKDFDSVRIAKDGQSAHYKHGQDGNSESERGTFPLMYPSITNDRLAMITDQHYDFLQVSMYQRQFTEPQEGRSSSETSKSPGEFFKYLTFGDPLPPVVIPHTRLGIEDPEAGENGHWITFIFVRTGDTVLMQRSGEARPGKGIAPENGVGDPALTILAGFRPVTIAASTINKAVEPMSLDGEAEIGEFEVFVPGAPDRITVFAPSGKELLYTVGQRPEITNAVAEQTAEGGLKVTWDAHAVDLPARLELMMENGATRLVAIGTDNGVMSLAADDLLNLPKGELELAVGFPGRDQKVALSGPASTLEDKTLRIRSAQAKVNDFGGVDLVLTFNMDVSAASAALSYTTRSLFAGEVPLFGAPGDEADSLRFSLLAAPKDCSSIELKVVQFAGLPDDIVIADSFDVLLLSESATACDSLEN